MPTHNLDTPSKRLKYLIEQQGIKQSYMAEKLGLSPSGLHYILNNDTKFSKNAKKVAEFMNVNQSWLETGEGEIYPEQTDNQQVDVPVFYLDQLLIKEESSEHILQPVRFIKSNLDISTRNLFAILNARENNKNKLAIGDILVFEKTELTNNGCVALVLDKTQMKIGLYRMYNAQKIFLVNEDQNTLETFDKSSHKLVGVLKECIRLF